MPQLTPAEHARLARLTLERTRRRAVARVLGSPLMRWRYGAPIADELLLVPQDLRTGDPTFAGEVHHGHFGMAGRVAYIGTGSPFNLVPPSREWARELHGFGWLRHLMAAGHEPARATALNLVRAWIRSGQHKTKPAREPAVIGRRLISWITNAGWLLEGVDQATYDLVTDSLGDQLVRLSATWRDAPRGYPRLLALTALIYGDLCIAGHERQLNEIVGRFGAELDEQIYADGGHVSRNPAVLAELLLDLLPLRQCFATRGRPPPIPLNAAVRRMIGMLRFLRLGDGTLGRFNGMGAPSVDALATVLAYDDIPCEEVAIAPQSRYGRLSRGETVVLADVGSPPPLELASHAHAGCLSFEVSAGAEPIFVNGGAPGPAEQDWQAAARATASHNTLCLGARSSSKLVRHALLESLVGGTAIRFPKTVTADLSATEGGDQLEAAHDGYMRPFGLMHHRTLMLDKSGRRLTGRDHIRGRRRHVRLARDLPFSIHFHLHSGAVAQAGASPGTVEITLKSGARWRFTCGGAQLSMEESIHYADLAGPRQGVQIVLRGATFGDSEVSWTLEQIE